VGGLGQGKNVIVINTKTRRLRPLSLVTAKPLIPLAGEKSIMYHQISALVNLGVTEIILAINYLPEIMMEHSSKWEKELGIKIYVVKEDKPLGTAGCIKNCEHLLRGQEPFYVLNADISTDFSVLCDMMKFHESNPNCHATMLVTKVDDFTKFGVVIYDEKKQIQRFVEKPKVYCGSNMINSGVYIFDPCVLDRLPEIGSIEREVFPKLAQDGWMYCHELQSYWIDLGTIPDFLTGNKLYMQHRGLKNIIHETSTVGANCEINNSAIGPNCIVGDNVCIKDSVVLEGSIIESGAHIEDSIVGWKCYVKRWAKLFNNAVLSLDVTVEKGVVLNNTHVISHKSIEQSIFEPKKIIM
jgi:mannose-1-phosphate guanylyltransferase